MISFLTNSQNVAHNAILGLMYDQYFFYLITTQNYEDIRLFSYYMTWYVQYYRYEEQKRINKYLNAATNGFAGYNKRRRLN